MKNYILNFKGYYLNQNVNEIPNESGIYIVYRCVYDGSKREVALKEIIYIGQSKNLSQRLLNHDKMEEFISHCKKGESLCFSYALVEEDSLDLVENALIYAQKPICNDELKNSYNYEAATFNIEGRCSLLKYNTFQIS